MFGKKHRVGFSESGRDSSQYCGRRVAIEVSSYIWLFQVLSAFSSIDADNSG